MSTHPVEPPVPGRHLELPVDAQLARARHWVPSEEPVLTDLTEDEEAAFLDALSR